MLGLLSSVFPIGSVVGPSVGGFVVEHFGWRYTFLVNVPIALAVTVWGAKRIPRLGRRTGTTKIDYGGALLLTVAVGLLMVSLTELGRDSGGGHHSVVVVGVAGALVGGALLLRHERRTPHPLIDLALLRRREFAFLNALNFLYGICIFGMVSFVALYAQEGYGLSASQAGVLLTPRAMAMVATSVLASMFLDRTGFRRPIGVGLGILAVSAALLSAGHGMAERSGMPELVYLGVVVTLLGVGLGIAGPSANQAGLDLLPDQVAAVTGLRGMFRALGGAVGTAAIASVASRATTPAHGLELAFIGLAVLAVAAIGLLPGIPDRPVGSGPRGRSGPVPVPNGRAVSPRPVGGLAVSGAPADVGG